MSITGVPAEIARAELHFFLNKLLFLRRHPDDELLRSGSVLQICSSPLWLWLWFLKRVWAAPNKHNRQKVILLLCLLSVSPTFPAILKMRDAVTPVTV
jgi:hypothetical protein